MISIPVSPELADMIVRDWLKRHINYAIDTTKNATHEEDRAAATDDIAAMTHILNYIGEVDNG